MVLIKRTLRSNLAAEFSVPTFGILRNQVGIQTRPSAIGSITILFRPPAHQAGEGPSFRRFGCRTGRCLKLSGMTSL